MIIEIDDNEPLAAQIQWLINHMLTLQRRSRDHVAGLPGHVRVANELGDVVVSTESEAVKIALAIGVSTMLKAGIIHRLRDAGAPTVRHHP